MSTSTKKITKKAPPEPSYPIKDMKQHDCLEVKLEGRDTLSKLRKRIWAYKDHLVKTGQVPMYAKFKSKIDRTTNTVYLWRIL